MIRIVVNSVGLVVAMHTTDAVVSAAMYAGFGAVTVHDIEPTALVRDDAGGGGFALPDASFGDGAEMIAGMAGNARAQIDAIRDTAYTRSPARGDTFTDQETEAQRYVDAGSPMPVDAAVYPFLARLGTVRAASAADLAANTLVTGAMWRAFSAEVEGAHDDITAALTGATDRAAAGGALDAIVANVATQAAPLAS